MVVVAVSNDMILSFIDTTRHDDQRPPLHPSLRVDTKSQDVDL